MVKSKKKKSAGRKDVDMEKDQFSYNDIKTKALSTYLGLLLDGSLVRNKEFCVLSHSSKIDEFDDDDVKDLLVHLIRKLKTYMVHHITIQSIKHLKLMVVGGAVDEYVLTREAFSLLNQDIDLSEFRQLTTDDDDIYLLNCLKNSVKIIEPVTFVITDEEETKGE